MSISSILNNDYSMQTQKKTKKCTSKVESVDQTQELSDAEKLENFKKEIWYEINSMPRSSSISWSIKISDDAFERMMNEPEFKEKVMNLIREDATVGRSPITACVVTVDVNGYSGYSYMNQDIGNKAYSAHSKEKNNFYTKKAKTQDTNDFWEQQRLEREQLREIFDEQYEKKLYVNKVYKHKEEIARLYEEKTFVKE